MNTTELLLMQVKSQHEFLNGTMADVEEKHAHTNPGGATHSIAANYGHVIHAEDAVINGMLQGKPPLSASTWKGKTGFSKSYPEDRGHGGEWMKDVKIDLTQLKEYAAAVQKQSEEYVASLPEADIDKKLQLQGMGEQSVAFVLANIVIGHIASHTGEISAIKGLKGAKGYPF